MYNLTQSQNRYKKELLKEWPKLSQFSKALLFLSLQMVQKRYKGATFLAFFLFLPRKEPPQLKSNPLTEGCITHCTPNKAKISCHKMELSDNEEEYDVKILSIQLVWLKITWHTFFSLHACGSSISCFLLVLISPTCYCQQLIFWSIQVADVKKNIELVHGTDVYPAAQQMLIHQGKVLKDATTLDENQVAESSFVVIMLSKVRLPVCWSAFLIYFASRLEMK